MWGFADAWWFLSIICNGCVVHLNGDVCTDGLVNFNGGIVCNSLIHRYSDVLGDCLVGCDGFINQDRRVQ